MFSSSISLFFALFIFPSILNSLPAAEKHHHSMILPPPCFTVGMGARFPSDVTLGIQAKHFNLGSYGLRVFRCLLANTKRAVICLLLRSGFHLATDWWSAAKMVVLLEGSPISTEEIWSSVRVTIRFLFTSLTKALLPRLLSLVVTNILFKNDGGLCVLGDRQRCIDFWYPSPDL
jgi:hypothetical protein